MLSKDIKIIIFAILFLTVKSRYMYMHSTRPVGRKFCLVRPWRATKSQSYARGGGGGGGPGACSPGKKN